MARRAGGASSVARHPGAIFAAARRLLLAASEGRSGRGAETGGVLSRNTEERFAMPKYVIEREILGADNMTPQDLQAVSQTSCGVLQKLEPQIQWLHSYVTGDKIYCVYIAPNEELIREHAQQGGFPANRISEIKSVIDPTTAEEKQTTVTA